MLETAGLPPIDSAGRQVVHVRVDAGYWPRSIVARAGTPTRIVFQRADRDECSSRVVFSSPRLERRLTPNGETTVDLPARPAGEIRFTCGMGRYRGSIRFVDERSRLAGRARALATHRGTAVALLAVVLAVVGFAVSAPVMVGAALALLLGALLVARGAGRQVHLRH